MDREDPKPTQTQTSILSTIGEKHDKVKWFFNDTRVFIVFDIITAFFWTAILAFYMPMVTSIELQFQLTSKKIGFRNSFMGIGRTQLLLILPFFGERFHTPRLLGAMAILRVVALVMLFLSHFLFGKNIVTLLKATMHERALALAEKLLYAGNFAYTTPSCHYREEPLDIAALTEGLMDDSRIAYDMFIASCGRPTLGMAYFDNNFDKFKLPLLLVWLHTGLRGGGALVSTEAGAGISLLVAGLVSAALFWRSFEKS